MTVRIQVSPIMQVNHQTLTLSYGALSKTILTSQESRANARACSVNTERYFLVSICVTLPLSLFHSQNTPNCYLLCIHKKTFKDNTDIIIILTCTSNRCPFSQLCCPDVNREALHCVVALHDMLARVSLLLRAPGMTCKSYLILLDADVPQTTCI